MLLELVWRAFLGAAVIALVLKYGVGAGADGTLVFAVSFTGLLVLLPAVAAADGWIRERRKRRDGR